MIPVLAVPILTGPELLDRMFASVDVPVGMRLVIDNGGGVAAGHALGAWHVNLPEPGLPVAASWNLAIKLAAVRGAPWLAIVNHDVVFATGDLATLSDAMAAGAGVATLSGFAAFGISLEAVSRVGLFDESFVPAYCEDADMEYRARLAGIPIVPLRSGVTHATSSTIGDPSLRAENARTYPENRAYYRAKWGGDLRGGETYETPFDTGAGPDEWTLDVLRLRDLAWRTSSLRPHPGETR